MYFLLSFFSIFPHFLYCGFTSASYNLLLLFLDMHWSNLFFVVLLWILTRHWKHVPKKNVVFRETLKKLWCAQGDLASAHFVWGDRKSNLIYVHLSEGKITFSGKTVTLTCPKSGNWFDIENVQITGLGKTESFEFDYTRQVQYSCKYTDTPDSKPQQYKFYIKGRGE